MLTLNDLLRSKGIDPKEVRVLRHTSPDYDLHAIWRTDRHRFEGYQERQLPNAFRSAKFLAAFIVDHAGRPVFAGLYGIDGEGSIPVGDIDPVNGQVTVAGENGNTGSLYETSVVPEFEEFEDRLVIDWGAGTRSWNQWADRNEKRVVEIAAQQETPWPGWRSFRCPVDDLHLLPRGWRSILQATRGIYLLTDAAGQLYVGSAKGTDGLLGRWDGYRGGRSGGNVGLARDAIAPFTAAVLETFDGGVTNETIELAESEWKTKLGARETGLNRN